MIAIVGGGISGLSAAYYVSKAGLPCTLFEALPRLGGVIQTESIEGCVVEAGPDSWLASKPAALALIAELGLADQVIGSNDSLRKTWIWKNRRLVPMPDGIQMMVPTRVMPMLRTPLLGAGTKLRMAMELFRRPVHHKDRSVAEFVADHFGEEAVEYLAEPLLSGVYGGDCAALSAQSVLPRFVEFERKYGSVTRGALAARTDSRSPLFQTLKGGLGQLTTALQAAIEGKTAVVNCRVEAIERVGDAYRMRTGGDWFSADAVVLACGTQDAAAVVDADLGDHLKPLLSSIPYNSSMVIALGFRRSQLTHPLNGFGFLVPRRERRLLMACTWVGTKFEHRVPSDFALLRCFAAGSPAQTDADLTAVALEELGDVMGIAAQPVFSRVFRWPDAMAQYTVGHQRRVRELEKILDAFPGLHLIGNGYHGIGIPDCIRLAKEVAGKLKP